MKKLSLVIPGALLDLNDNSLDENISISVENSFEGSNSPQCIVESEAGSVIFSLDKSSARLISKYFAELALELPK